MKAKAGVRVMSLEQMDQPLPCKPGVSWVIVVVEVMRMMVTVEVMR